LGVFARRLEWRTGGTLLLHGNQNPAAPRSCRKWRRSRARRHEGVAARKNLAWHSTETIGSPTRTAKRRLVMPTTRYRLRLFAARFLIVFFVGFFTRHAER